MHILEFLTVIFVGILPSAVSSLIFLKRPELKTVYPRNMNVAINTIQSLTTILVLGYIASQNEEGWKMLGLVPDGLGWGEVGILFAGFFILVIYGGIRSRALKGKQNPSAIAPMFSLYDTLPTRIAYWLNMMLAVLAEDLVFRGYLVLWLGSQTGSYLGWAILSVALSVVVHLYQGAGMVGYQIIFATTFVLIAIVAGNIYLVLAFHMFWDSLQVIRFWAKMDKTKQVETEAAVGVD